MLQRVDVLEEKVKEERREKYILRDEIEKLQESTPATRNPQPETLRLESSSWRPRQPRWLLQAQALPCLRLFFSCRLASLGSFSCRSWRICTTSPGSRLAKSQSIHLRQIKSLSKVVSTRVPLEACSERRLLCEADRGCTEAGDEERMIPR